MPDQTRKDDANYGGKIFLPVLALNKLTRMQISYPMLFQLTNEANGKLTHSGVLEFVAEEGRVYMPHWMMKTLELDPGDLVKINSCDLPKGKFVKIEPQSVSFLDISDPKAVLENVLRKFTTLTVNDIIEISYNDTIYEIKILEAKPEVVNAGICVIETDLETDFAPPVGYVEPKYTPKAVNKKKVSNYGQMASSIGYAEMVGHKEDGAFKGEGLRLSGKTVEKEEAKVDVDKLSLDGPIKPLRLPDNQLFFGFPLTPPPEQEEKKEETEAEKKFEGTGISLRDASKKRKNNKGHSKHKAKVRSPGSSAAEPMEID